MNIVAIYDTLYVLSFTYLFLAGWDFLYILYGLSKKEDLFEEVLVITPKIKRAGVIVAVLGAIGTFLLIVETAAALFLGFGPFPGAITHAMAYFCFALATKTVRWITKIVVKV